MKSCYEKIIDYEWKGSPGRVRMPLEQRAKIFAPFAALRGYSELLRVAEEAEQRFEGHKKIKEEIYDERN